MSLCFASWRRKGLGFCLGRVGLEIVGMRVVFGKGAGWVASYFIDAVEGNGNGNGNRNARVWSEFGLVWLDWVGMGMEGVWTGYGWLLSLASDFLRGRLESRLRGGVN